MFPENNNKKKKWLSILKDNLQVLKKRVATDTQIFIFPPKHSLTSV